MDDDFLNGRQMKYMLQHNMLMIFPDLTPSKIIAHEQRYRAN